MDNTIYRTRRDSNGKFDSLEINHDSKQAVYRFNDSFINKCNVVSYAKLQDIRRQAEKDGYEVIGWNSWGW